uniref:CDT1 Geminin-binding domain-containing protein n=1 Tax=Vitis vinifera TaxID=29760 RepID=F6HE82_VITVI
MNCSLRLLGLRKKPTTFQNICTQVEILTKRKFSYRHLAQIKYILPEVVQIDYILIHDVKSLCMKPDMKISLLFDVIEGHQEKSTFMALRQVFAYRLLDFFNIHPEVIAAALLLLVTYRWHVTIFSQDLFELNSVLFFGEQGCDIPEAILPEPFNQRTQNIIPKSLPVDSSIESQPTSEVELLANSCHLNPSFRRHFSEKAVVAETGKTQLLASLVPLLSSSSDIVTNKEIKSEQHKESSELYSESTIIKPPVGLICPQSSVSSSACESPYLKHPMVSDCLMVETPAQLTPKRSMPSCDNKLKTVTRQMGTSCHMPTKRSLDFSCLEGDESVLNTLDEPECHKVIHDTLSQTVEAKGIVSHGEYNE